jgi:L-ascorbate metabolism protein UlaG (beta-lactamase superfamily)
MIPIDAMTNLGFEDIVKVVEQVKPPIMIAMHYDVAFAERLQLGLAILIVL